MELSTAFLRKLHTIDPDLREIIYLLVDELERHREASVSKSDFNELKKIVGELAEAQNRSEQRLDSLTQKMEELAQAQKRTEIKLGELAEAQNRSEQRLDSLTQKMEELAQRSEQRLDSLTQKMEELAQAQKRTEIRLEELAEAQKRTEIKVEELAEAQKKTEQHFKKHLGDFDNVKKQLGGLSDAVGYGIEDRLMPFMKPFVKNSFDIEADVVDRRFVVYPDGADDEVNIYVEGCREGKKCYVVGECKSQPGRKDVEKFSGMLKRLKSHLQADITPVLIGYQFSPKIEAYLKEKHPDIRYFKTFEIELKAGKQKS